MKKKSGRRISPENNWRHRKSKFYQFPVSKVLKEHIQIILASVLLLVMLGLLVGIFTHFQAPDTNNPTPNVSVVDYHAFISQVKANNVLTVTIHGDQVTGTLARSLQDQSCKTTPANSLLACSTGYPGAIPSYHFRL